MKKKILFVFFTLLTAALICSEAIFSAPLRLHVIANSDSVKDQSIKLIVRDTVLSESKKLLSGALTKSEAKRRIRSDSEALKEAADKALAGQDAGYASRIETGKYQFPEKSCGDLTYPAGEYDALKVVLGEGRGHNWWCVIYPDICGLKKTAGKNKIVIKSAIIEWIRKLIKK